MWASNWPHRETDTRGFGLYSRGGLFDCNKATSPIKLIILYMTYNKSKKHIYTALLSLVILSLAIIAISMSPMTVNAQLYQLYNPTNVQGTNSQSVLNAQLKNELIARYGSVYYSCVASVPPPVAGGMNQYTYGGDFNII